jgi:hypothetical protein
MAQDAITKPVTNIPTFVPGGARATEHLRRSAEWWKSDAILYTDTTTINLFEIPGNSIVMNMYVHVTTAFDASGSSAAATATITVPNDTGTITLFDASTIMLQTTGPNWSTGEKGTVVPASGGYIIMTYTPGTTTKGQCEVYVEVVQLEDRLSG